MNLKKSLFPFVLLSLLHLIGHLLGQETLHMGTKPLLMPALGFYFWKECPVTPLNKFVYLALLFSWLGDSLLIFSDYKELFFMMGLIGFLIAHIVYIIMNLNFVNDGNSRLVFKWPSLAFILLGILIFSQLLENLGSMSIPVAIYTSVICMMGITAYGRADRTQPTDYRLIMAGALLFIISDSILAFNQFKQPIAFAGIWVMTSYLAGQYLLIQGYLCFIKELSKE